MIDGDRNILTKELNELVFELFEEYDQFLKWKVSVIGKYDEWIYSMRHLRVLVKYLRHIKRSLRASELARDLLNRYNLISLRDENFGTSIIQSAKPKNIKLSAIKPMCDIILLGCHDKRPFITQNYEERNMNDYALEIYVDIIKKQEDMNGCERKGKIEE